ncbi:MAG TPA: ribosome biogenesis GTP-binding protein YihA/YsxC [Terriglobales bacterium]|nr:ribosome biogenesis GTP-binding protein YihA/YsxC [Terriglobales bacterium]
MRVLSRFLRAATDPAHFPPPIFPEIAFLGRSNVGKSSVINSLLGNKVARTSSAPGRTRAINFFEVRRPGQPRPELVFTDLPGYGYAKVAHDVVQQWPTFIEPYLRERPCLALCLALVDPNIPPQPSDKELQEFLGGLGRPFVVVATKCDRLSGNQLRSALATLAEEFEHKPILAYSARTGDGREGLWKKIREATAPYGQTQSGTNPETGLRPQP